MKAIVLCWRLAYRNLASRISALVIIHLFTPLANYAFQLAPLILFLAENLNILNPLALDRI